MKSCRICGLEKDFFCFPKDKNRKDGYYVYCKECRKKTYKVKSEEIKEKGRKYYRDNKEKNYEKIKKRNSIWRKNNPTYATDRKKIDPKFKLIKNIRRRLSRFLESKKLTKRNTTIDLIGCCPNQLKEYIENKFTEGMTWDNQGMWHIDHIIPLSSAKNIDDLSKLAHYTNLQPLWAKDNLAKSNKLDYL